MSKHSKWAKIKRKKGVADVKKGAAFTKLLNAVTIAVREGGGADPAGNFKLRLAVDAARAENVPKENIERAIERGSGKSGAAALESVLYEGFGPGGVAIMVEALTDNRNRTVNEVKKMFSQYGGAFASPGAVSWGFARKGVLRLERTASNGASDELELAFIDAGADDVKQDDGMTVVISPPEQLEKVRATAEQASLKPADAGIEWIATNQAPAIKAEELEQLIELLGALEEHDDVVSVATNATFT